MSLNGRKSDYLYIKGGQPFRCAYCHSKFSATAEHVFKKRRANDKTKYFCSYRCMNRWEHEQADRDRQVMRTDSGMKMSLQSWASIYELNYYDFWKKVMIEKVKPKDAVMILRID